MFKNVTIKTITDDSIKLNKDNIEYTIFTLEGRIVIVNTTDSILLANKPYKNKQAALFDAINDIIRSDDYHDTCVYMNDTESRNTHIYQLNKMSKIIQSEDF